MALDMDVIDVSGDSPTLRWLIASCQKSAPWLKLRDGELKIDWDQALKQRAVGGSSKPISPEVLAVLKRLLPALPLKLIRDLNLPRHAYSDRDRLSLKTFGEPTEIPSMAIEALSDLKAHIDQICVAVGQALEKKNRRDYRYDLLAKTSSMIESVGQVCDIRYVRTDLTIRYGLANRLLVYHGDMRSITKGSCFDDSYLQQNAPIKQQAETWRLAKRLVRAHADFYQKLENDVLSGILPDVEELATSPLADAWRRLGQIECALARKLGFGLKKAASGQMSYFTSVTNEYKVFTTHPTEALQREANFHGDSYFRDARHDSPLSSALARLNQLPALLQRLEGELIEKSHVLLLDSATKVAKTAVKCVGRANHDLIKNVSTTLNPALLDEAIDWLIAESPLLTLLAAGFFKVYSTHVNSDRYFIALSPWVAATIVAKKQLGTLPMTYLSVDSACDEEGEKEGEDVEHPESSRSISKRSTPITGRSLWELVQSTM